jgi:acylphosphatase
MFRTLVFERLNYGRHPTRMLRAKPMTAERRRVFCSGRVQGVGFRFRCERLARGFTIAGYVRNLHDGRVELVAEGEPAELDSFLEAVRRELGDKIRNVESETEPAADPPLSGFIIRY